MEPGGVFQSYVLSPTSPHSFAERVRKRSREDSFSSDETIAESVFGVVERRELVAARQLRRLRSCSGISPRKRKRQHRAAAYERDDWLNSGHGCTALGQPATDVVYGERLNACADRDGNCRCAEDCLRRLKALHEGEVLSIHGRARDHGLVQFPKLLMTVIALQHRLEAMLDAPRPDSSVRVATLERNLTDGRLS